MKRIFPVLVIFLLVACAAPTTPTPVISTQEKSTPTPTPTQTLPPTATPTETLTPTPTALPIPPEARTLVEQGAVYDDEKKLAYDPSTGAVLAMLGANEKWYYYENGILSIPAGDGSGDPPLDVPIYNNIEDALWGEKDKFPWNDDRGRYLSRGMMEEFNRIGRVYLGPMTRNEPIEWPDEDFFGKSGVLSSTNSPDDSFAFSISNWQITGGRVMIKVTIFSETSNYMPRIVFVDGDVREVYEALMNGEIFVPGPDEVRGDVSAMPATTPTRTPSPRFEVE
ncbi:MAG: hypothetical protein LC099_10975 [Anaerolineales bacterium]|nr:hypothetical protein [Anaerolineales bacterium]